jgi:phosphate transport system protein
MNVIPMRAEEQPQSDTSQIMELTLKACDIAQSAVAHVADGLASRSPHAFAAANDCERELDRIDHDVDDRVTMAISGVSPAQARELLACLKCTTDLERIGDLISGFGTRAQVIGSRVEMEDIRDLIHMASALEKMLADIRGALAGRELDRAISVLRADAELDRLRNLLHIRHVENREGLAGPEGVQVLFMAQALERAGDHVKNMAEEVCHLVSGRSVRHVMQAGSKSDEQMFIDWLRQKQAKA